MDHRGQIHQHRRRQVVRAHPPALQSNRRFRDPSSSRAAGVAWVQELSPTLGHQTPSKFRFADVFWMGLPLPVVVERFANPSSVEEGANRSQRNDLLGGSS